MRTIAFIAFLGIAAAACTPTTTGTVGGTAVGATTGAIVGGPVGALVGGAIGATAGTATGATVAGGPVTAAAGPAPGRCYVYDQAGNPAIDRRGRPVTVRC